MVWGLGGGRVVPFMGLRGGARVGILAEVRAYWEGLRDGGPVPFRAQVDPRGIERALEHMMILERIAPGQARIRLAGMRIADLLAMEPRGLPLMQLFAPPARAELAARLEGVFAGPEIAEIALAAERGLGRPPLDGTLLLLPLRSDAGEVSRALACLVTEGQTGRAPRRFQITGAVSAVVAGHAEGLRAGVNLTPAPRPNPAPWPAARPAPGMAEAAAPFAGPAPARRSGRPALRLVRTED